MSIHVTDFKWEKGKNDLEYIALLEKNLDAMKSKYRECAKVAREQYKKGEQDGRADERKKVIDELYAIALNESYDTLIEWLQNNIID